MSQLSKLINGHKKTITNNETKKEEEILYLFSHPIEKNDKHPSSVCEFILGQKLGGGTFGTVRLAINRQTNEKVAIKILDKTKMTNYDDKKRLEKEINILKKIHHPNIVKLFCVIETERIIYLVMEYIKGNELFHYILMRKKLEEEEACYFFLQIINCIDYLIKLKIAHRDLKAENIIIEQNKKEIKLIDFGLSNIYENNQLLSTACGSPIYAAPEMLLGKPYKGSTVDIWSAGILLYYMLCGNFPFEDVSNAQLYKKILKGKFEIPKFVSKNAKDLINKILVVNPQKRINIKDIKKHPWVLTYLEKNKSYENIFKNIGLNIGQYIIPIDEDIVSEINSKYNVDKVQIRKNILFNIDNDISTIYYLLLNKKIKDGIKSIADMKSDLFENYIKDKNNLLSSYNNDINNVFNKRKNGAIEENDIPTTNNNNVEENPLNNDEKTMKNNQSYTNVISNKDNSNNTNNNKTFYEKKNTMTLNKNKNRCISVGNPNYQCNPQLNQVNIKRNKIRNDYKKAETYKVSLHLSGKKPDFNKSSYVENNKNKSINVKKKINIKSQTSNKKNKTRNDSPTKSEKIKKEKINHLNSEKKEITKKIELNEDINKTVNLDYGNNKINLEKIDNNNNTIDNNLTPFNSSEIGEKNNEEFNDNKNINKKDTNDFNNSFSENKNIENNKNKIENTPKKNENENENKLINNNDNNDKNNCDNNNDNNNLNYYTLNVNPSTEKKLEINKNKNLSNCKIKNKLVLFTNKNINKNNILIDKDSNSKKNSVIKNKNVSIKENKNLDQNTNINKSNNIQKNVKIKGKSTTSGNFNKDEDANLGSRRNKENIKKHYNNKSVDIKGKKENLNKINTDNLSNYKKQKSDNPQNIKKNTININKMKFTKKNEITNVKTPMSNNHILFNNNNIINDIYKPHDINCIFIENEKYIKNELSKLNGHKDIKIKNISSDKFSINIKSLDLLVELLIVKNDNNSLINLKVKKLKGKNIDYIKQLNQIINEIYVHKKK